MEEKLASDVHKMTISRNLNTSDWIESGDSPKNIPENVSTPENSSRINIEAHQNQLERTSSPELPHIHHSIPERCPRHQCQHNHQRLTAPTNTIHYNMNPNYLQNAVASPSGQTKIVRDEGDYTVSERNINNEPHFTKTNPNVTIHQCNNMNGRSNPHESKKIYETSSGFVCNKHLDQTNRDNYAFRRDVSNNFMNPEKINRQHLCQHHLIQANEHLGRTNIYKEHLDQEKDFNNNTCQENVGNQNNLVQLTSNEIIPSVNSQEQDNVSLNEAKLNNSPRRNNRVTISKSLQDLEPSQPAELKCVRKKKFREDMSDCEENKKETKRDSVRCKSVKFEEDVVEFGYPPLKKDVEASRRNNVSQKNTSNLILKKCPEKLPAKVVVQKRNGLG